MMIFYVDLHVISCCFHRGGFHYETSIICVNNRTLLDLNVCFQVFDRLLNGDVDPYPSFFQNATGCTNYFNYMTCQVLRNTSKPNICVCLLRAKPFQRMHDINYSVCITTTFLCVHHRSPKTRSTSLSL